MPSPDQHFWSAQFAWEDSWDAAEKQMRRCVEKARDAATDDARDFLVDWHLEYEDVGEIIDAAHETEILDALELQLKQHLSGKFNFYDIERAIQRKAQYLYNHME